MACAQEYAQSRIFRPAGGAAAVKPPASPPHSLFTAEIAGDRKRLLLKSVGATTVPTIAAAAMVTAAFWSRVEPWSAAAWLAATIGVALYRYLVVKGAGDAADPAVLASAHRRTLLGAAMAAALWVAGTPLFANGDFGDLMALSFLYMTLCCAGTISLSVFRPAFFLFVPPIMAAMIVAVVGHAVAAPADRANAAAVTAALILITVVFLRLMRQTDRQLNHTLSLNYQNLRLLDDVQENHRHTAAETDRQTRRREALETLAGDFESGVSEVMARTDAASGLLRRRTAETVAAATETRRLAEEAAQEVRAVNDDVLGLSAMAAALATSTDAVDREVSDAAAIARASVARMTDAGRTMAAMIEASRRIGEIVGLISVIARQTNLLALNAAIEAQRVGEAGRGFAVVAAEVKALADQTERASKEVSAHIGRVQTITGDAEGAIRVTLETVERIDAIAAKAAAGVRSQQATAGEIGDGLGRVSGRTVAAADKAQQLDAAAGQAATAASALDNAVARLSGDVAETMDAVHGFLADAKRLQ